MSAKIVLRLNQLFITDNGENNVQTPINCVMAMTWKTPNYEQPLLVSAPVTIKELTAKQSYQFPDLSDGRKMAFKTISDGTSLLEVELLATKDVNIISKIVDALLSAGVEAAKGATGVLPWVGAALSALVTDAEISKEKIVQLAKGEITFDESLSGQMNIPLRCGEEITIRALNTFPGQPVPEIERVIKEGADIGILTLVIDRAN